MTALLGIKPELTIEINNTNYQNNPLLCIKTYKIGISAKIHRYEDEHQIM
jgi:hypothetical protein